MKKPEDTDYPIFGEIRHVVVVRDSIYVAAQLYTTLGFNHRYEVCLDNTYSVVLVSHLALYQVLHKYTINLQTLIVVRSCDHIEFLFNSSDDKCIIIILIVKMMTYTQYIENNTE